MKSQFKKSFAKDLAGIKDKKLHTRVKALIQRIENSGDLSQIADLKKLRGHSGYYRVRIGDYRAGLIVKGEVVTFVRCLARKEIYRYFP